ncbi:uncharacterized protein PHACADRAFT_262116 [Phanerochaete carnosa HHB-10118-sp]|uniref:Uncharacterized protein n=1 Tax=Phanerochaete carnosa (strain HHB-10118-sp) TaxID=650164 RepID=K5VYU8_PHACS|nr:uncharacterized protein PHACADRAFT_262116 [Phanerochaete carnosa HHB-10118-sp]EKM51779.1 hypothetical protein PHACADRAFT_262116 [Phanerochaete carnosa HHB-10118-sp]
MSLPLSGKVALVTGSSRNIGAAVAKRLADDGASVVINYNGSEGAANELVEKINEEGNGKAVAIQADVSSTEGGNKLIEETVNHFGQLDILVLNAGMMKNVSFDAIDEKLFDDHFTVNVKVPLFMVKTASKHLKAGARVVFFSSATTKFSSVPPNYLIYTATKGAIEQMTRVLAKDLGAKGINVNAIAPGPTDTDLFRAGKSEQLVQFFSNLHPQKRIPQPNEIAPIIAFLSRDEAGWINGQTIFVNGGYAV